MLRSANFVAKMIMEKNNWITTEQMLEDLRNDPDNEQEYTHYICGLLRSTHWLMYSSEKDQYGHSMNISYDWYTKEEFLEIYAGHWWRRDV